MEKTMEMTPAASKQTSNKAHRPINFLETIGTTLKDYIEKVLGDNRLFLVTKGTLRDALEVAVAPGLYEYWEKR